MNPQRYSEIIEQEHWIVQYNWFAKAKNLGLKWDAKDFTIEQIEILHFIDSTVKEFQEAKEKVKNGKAY
jgi:hypothetical protein